MVSRTNKFRGRSRYHGRGKRPAEELEREEAEVGLVSENTR